MGWFQDLFHYQFHFRPPFVTLPPPCRIGRYKYCEPDGDCCTGCELWSALFTDRTYRINHELPLHGGPLYDANGQAPPGELGPAERIFF